jgi:hypothetical protein
MAITGPSPARPLGAGEADAGPALAEFAFSLGYSEVSAFNHALRRWSANRRAIIVNYARFISNPPQRTSRSRPARGSI